MPELPEVETVMRGLAAPLEGRVIRRAALARDDLRRMIPDGFAAALTGARVTGFRRRGKYILMRITGGQDPGGQSVLIHLGMSGRMAIHGPHEPPPGPAKHEHLVMETEEGWRIGFIDPRRFGLLDLMPTAAEETHPLLAGMGPEPLGADFTVASLSAALAERRSPIKIALLDQRLVAGLGNIYVSEALFRAGISPRRRASTIPGARAARLVPAIRATLTEAIAAGGSSLRDYRQPDGELGYFQHAWKVYGREGERCEACREPARCPGIQRIVQAGRSTFFCPRAQR